MSGLIGRRVTWRHLDQEGKPFRDLTGEVVAFTHTQATLLVLTDEGVIETASFADVRVISVDDEQAWVRQLTAKVKDLEGELAAAKHIDPTPTPEEWNSADVGMLASTIKELGLADEQTDATPISHAAALLREFMTELTAHDAKVKALEAEVEKLKAKKPKAEKPKKEEP